MSQSSAALNSPNPMKKKVITALIAVAIGHIGVLWAVSHIKPAELKPIEKKPLQVRFVKIQDQPKPLPPKPKEPPKKPEPKKEVKEVKIVEKTDTEQENQLYFINLGGYKRGAFAEFHEQHLMVGTSMGEVVKRVKKTEFYRTMGFEKATSHIDDKYGVDIDDIFRVNDILPDDMKAHYSIVLEKSDAENQENILDVGYFKIDKLEKI